MTNGIPASLSPAGRRHAILANRARRLARRRDQDLTVPFISCLVCEAGGELFGIPLLRLSRVVAAARLAVVPTSNPAMLGVTGRAGLFYQVYDLAKLAGGGETGADGHFAMLRGSPAMALSVDRALRVTDLVLLSADEASLMQARRPAVAGFARSLQPEFFEGRIISLIDPEKLASDDVHGQVEGD